MSTAVARKALCRTERDQADAGGGILCASVAFEGAQEGEPDGDGKGVARIWSAVHAAAASLMAQQRVGEEESVVRSRIAAGDAPARRQGVGLLIRSLSIWFGVLALAACSTPQQLQPGSAPTTAHFADGN